MVLRLFPLFPSVLQGGRFLDSVLLVLAPLASLARTERQIVARQIAVTPILSQLLWITPFFVACLFCALWIRGRLRESRHVARQQDLQLQLLSRTAELRLEKAELSGAREALRSHAVRDELTGVLNRSSILEVLDREMARAVRDKGVLSVVLADIDYFKRINDTHGTDVGNKVLKEVGARLEHAIRSYDAAGRYNGESSCWCCRASRVTRASSGCARSMIPSVGSR